MKLSISLYSFAREYFDRKYTLEQCIAKAAEIGYQGIEIIGPQMIDNYPNPKEEFYTNWHQWMEKYHVEPVCLDVFNEYMVLKTRKMTDEEQCEQLRRDIRIANRMGIPVVRVMNLYTPEQLEACIPDAEKYDVTLSLEVHGPKLLNDPSILKYLEMIDRNKTKRVSICPDISVFQYSVPPRMLKYYVAKGAKVELAEYCRKAYEEGVDIDTAMETCRKMGGTPLDVLMVKNCCQGSRSDYKYLEEFGPYITHIHAKCFDDLTPEGKDPTFDCELIADILKKIGYMGYVSTECEAFQYEPWQLFTEDLLRQHCDMWHKLVG